MTKLTSLVIAGSLVAMVGCALLPNSATSVLSNGGSKLDIGFAGTGYSTQGMLTTQASGSALTYEKILFKPTKIEVHYAGALSDLEQQATPSDIKGQDSDQSTANTGTESTASGEWIEFPVDNNATIDLANLSAGAVSFGDEALKAGKYDQIRITGEGSYEALDGTVEATGDYTLPSGRLYINQGFEVRDGYKTDLKFAFDAKTAMVSAADMVILKPSSVKVFAIYTKLVIADASPSTEASSSSDATSSQ